MKLRNKKTGEIGDFAFVRAIGDIDDTSLAELNEEWEDYTESAEPEPGYLVAKIQKLENSVKALDERLKAIEEKHGAQAPDNNVGTCVALDEFERMKEQLRDWVEQAPKTKHIEVNFIVNEKANDGRQGVQFIDFDEKPSLFAITFWDWPRIGLVDGAVYTPEELLNTGEAGKE
jgi:hypothetical protein